MKCYWTTKDYTGLNSDIQDYTPLYVGEYRIGLYRAIQNNAGLYNSAQDYTGGLRTIKGVRENTTGWYIKRMNSPVSRELL